MKFQIAKMTQAFSIFGQIKRNYKLFVFYCRHRFNSTWPDMGVAITAI